MQKHKNKQVFVSVPK